jgi:hypothetical protein
MTSISPHKLIRFGKYPLKKGPASSRQANPLGHDPRQPKKLSDQLNPVANLSAGIDFEGQLRAFENIARHEYLKISNSLSFPKLPPWFRQRLEQSILPTLNRIGFDESFGRILFAIAASPWKLMGPANEKIRVFHPGIDQKIEEIRRGLLMKAKEINETFLWYAGTQPSSIPETIKNNMSSENLFDLPDKIATPWIVLPRAFSFLKEQDSRYLPAYLKTIDRETNEYCLKLFIRIAVEFVGNYALKFANNRYPPDQLAKLLFYGFSAMLWKNLRRPPEGMENCAVFDNVLNWINMLARKSDFLGREEMKSIDQMIKMKTTAFPTRNFALLKNRSRDDMSHFVVTLRHGYPGISAVLKYFGMDQFSETRLADERLPGTSMLSELHGLLQAIQTSYHSESKPTKEYIKQFLYRLESICDLMQSDLHPTPTANKFLRRRFNNLQILFTK